MITRNEILVYLPIDAETENAMEDAEDVAEEETAKFQGTVFDWRDTSPEGVEVVLLGRENPEELVKRLENIFAKQQATIRVIEEDLRKYVKQKNYTENFFDMTKRNDMNILQNMQRLLNFQKGEYTEESLFYYCGTNTPDFYTGDETATITPEIIEQVKMQPESYALVTFMYHAVTT